MIHHQVLSKGEFGDLLARCHGSPSMCSFWDPHLKVRRAYDQAIDALVRQTNAHQDLDRAVERVVNVDPSEVFGGVVRQFLFVRLLPRRFHEWLDDLLDLVEVWEAQK
jgi:hypothetical protein